MQQLVDAAFDSPFGGVMVIVAAGKTVDALGEVFFQHLGFASDRDSPYWLLRGIAAINTIAMTLSLTFLHLFPFGETTYG